MNILCKIFGHKMVCNPLDLWSYWCKRKSCDHTEEVKRPDPPPMPKCKPPKLPDEIMGFPVAYVDGMDEIEIKYGNFDYYEKWETVGDSRCRGFGGISETIKKKGGVGTFPDRPRPIPPKPQS